MTSRIADDYKTTDLPEHGMTVRVTHAGLTVQDAMVVQGCSGAARSYPMIPGTDLAGIVLQVDEEAAQSGFRVGDRIVAGGRDGAVQKRRYSQIARVPAELAWRLPSDEQFESSTIRNCCYDCGVSMHGDRARGLGGVGVFIVFVP